jgi:hypothetical protein
MALFGGWACLALLLAAIAAIAFGWPRIIALIGFMLAVLVSGAQRFARSLLQSRQCEICGASLLPLLPPADGELSVPKRWGSPATHVLYQCATRGRLQCMSCGHEDGRRDESFRIRP